MAEWAGRHRDELAGLPHYHVIAENHDDEVTYSDGFTWPCARGFAADLISPPAGAHSRTVMTSRPTSRRHQDFSSK